MNYQDNIKKLITQASKTDSIHELIEISQRIAGGLVYLSTLETDAYRNYLECEYARKSFEAKYVKDSQESAAKAVKMAEVEASELREAEYQMEAEYKALQIFRMTATEYLQSIRQRISWAKHEYESQKETT